MTNPDPPPTWRLHRGDALAAYAEWDTPAVIISDGAYGVGGFPGDPRTPDGLADWYRPHVEGWTKFAHLSTTLWFWNTEIGWATVHPVLVENGWEYVEAIHWDKGIAHIAGNVNGKTIRRFPISNEICVFYQRRLEMTTPAGPMLAKVWLRHEWKRAGLAFRRANEACGVKDAATRKYFAQDWLWYFPPPETMEKLAAYANEHGDPAGRPYYSLDGVAPVTAKEWGGLRYTWTHQHGLTNVWQHPPLHSKERFRGTGKRHAPRVHNPKAGVASAHLNQKPLEFMRRIISAVTAPGDVVWEPFGGLCSAIAAAIELDRRGFASEPYDDFYELAAERLEDIERERRGEGRLFAAYSDE
jgi:site-specific DNA-methyltransferase (adenine-specific)